MLRVIRDGKIAVHFRNQLASMFVVKKEWSIITTRVDHENGTHTINEYHSITKDYTETDYDSIGVVSASRKGVYNDDGTLVITEYDQDGVEKETVFGAPETTE